MRDVVLVTGFKRFLKHRANPTERLVVEADGQRIGRTTLVGRVLPVEFRACERELESAIADVQPRALVMFGLAATRRTIALEAVAMNMDHGVDPDNCGERRWMREIRRGSPRLIDSRLPLNDLYVKLKRGRVPVGISYHAGTYVCNHVFYVGLTLMARKPAGFVHVPAQMPQAVLRRALRVIVERV